MKQISAGMTTHLGQVTTSLAMLWRITRRDGNNFYFTNHDVNIPFDDGDGLATYKSTSSFNPTAISNSTTLRVDNLDIEGVFNSGDVTETDLRAGRFDSAEVRISHVNWKNLADGFIRQKRGRFGNVVDTPSGIFRTELRSLSQELNQNIIDNYGPECPVDLGDSKCMVPIFPAVLGRSAEVKLGQSFRVDTAGGGSQSAYENRVYEVTTAGTTAGSQPTYDTTIGVTTTDGTAVLTARDAFMRDATILAVTGPRTFTITVSEARAVNDWFNQGGLTFEEGDNQNVTREIRDWDQGTGQIDLFLPMPFLPVVGQRIRLYPGCDKRLVTCRDRFANVLNFRGYPHVPGPDGTLRVQ